MLDVITKFIDWIKQAFSIITNLPSMLTGLVNSFSNVLAFLPNGLGTIILGFFVFAIAFAVILAIVKLVTNLL